MEINVNLKLDATKEFQDMMGFVGSAVYYALRAVKNDEAGQRDPLPWEQEAKPETSEADTVKQMTVPKKQESPKAETEEPQAMTDELPFKENEETQAPAEEPKKTVNVGKVEIRAAITEARKRCEYPDGGEDYDESLHKQMTACFKAIATRIHDGKKPTELEGDDAEQFIKACEGIHVEDGKVCPF